MNELNLIAYKTERGLYFANSKWNYNKVRECIYNVELVNGKPLAKSEHRGDWYFLEGEDTIVSIQTHKHGGYGETYWELRDPSAAIEGVIPSRINMEEAADLMEADGDWYIGTGSKYYTYRGLYDRKRAPLPQLLVDVPFTVEYKGTIEHILVENNYKDAKVKLFQPQSYTTKTVEQNLMSVVSFYELEQLMTPDLVLHNRPCYINSDTTYQIVRNWIKEHIDLKHARITSDYDFCFTVKKLVYIKPYVEKKEIKKANGKSYASPKFKTRSIETKEVEIFEMCPSKKYNSYTPIEGFKGDDVADLVENMRLFLDELMSVVNQPVHECQHCGGLGCTYTKVTDMNERQGK